jgi:hypothetical protein
VTPQRPGAETFGLAAVGWRCQYAANTADQLAAPTRARAGPAPAGRVVNDRRQRGRLLGLLPGGASGCHPECSTPVAAQLN